MPKESTYNDRPSKADVDVLGIRSLDALCDNELINMIPGIDKVLGLLKYYGSARDRLFMSRIQDFAFYIDSLNAEQKEALRAKLEKDSKSRIKFGESVIAVIEQCDSELKIEYVGCAFLAFINDEIGRESFLQICHGIRTSYSGALSGLVESEIGPDKDAMEALVTSGFISSQYVSQDLDGKLHMDGDELNTEVHLIRGKSASLGPIHYLSDVGEDLRKAWRDYRSNSKELPEKSES